MECITDKPDDSRGAISSQQEEFFHKDAGQGRGMGLAFDDPALLIAGCIFLRPIAQSMSEQTYDLTDICFKIMLAE